MQELYFYTSLTFYLILIIITAAISIFFFRKTRINSKLRKKLDGYNFLIGIFFLIQVFAFIIRVYFMFIYPQGNMTTFLDSILDPNFRATHLDYEKLVALHIMLIFIAFGTISLAIEHYIYKKTHHLLCILIYATAPFLVIFPYNIAVLLQYLPIIVTIMSVLIMIGFYTNLARKSSGAIRRKSTYIAIGFLLFFMGILVNSQSIMMALHLYTLHVIWVVPIWFTVALLILFYGYKKEVFQNKENTEE